MSKTKPQRFESVWEAIADSPEEAVNLRLRSKLMDGIANIIEANKWTQAEAAGHCGLTQPRINNLLRGKVSKFSLDALVNIATALGQRVDLRLRAA